MVLRRFGSPLVLLVWSGILSACMALSGCSQSQPSEQTAARQGEAGEEGEAAEKTKAGEEGEEGHSRHVTLSEEGLRSARIQTAKAERRHLVRDLAFTGELTFHPDRVAVVGSKVSARLLRIRAGVGDRVSKGQELATLDSMEFARARGEYRAAVARLEVTQAAYGRRQKLQEEGITSARELEEATGEASSARATLEAARGALLAVGMTEQEIKALRAGKDQTSTLSLRSPLSGKVVRRDAITGQTVEPSASLFTVADLSEVWVLLTVYERDLGRISADSAVTITTAAYPDRAFSGRVSHIAEVLEVGSRTAKVRVVLSNTDGALRPGMFVRAILSSPVVASPAQASAQLTRSEPSGQDRKEPHEEGEARDEKEAKEKGEAGTGAQARKEMEPDHAQHAPQGEKPAASEGDARGREALVVPTAAVQMLGDDDVVFVRTAERTFVARNVLAGERAGGYVEIRRGLRAGEEVATEGSLTLKAELERESLEGDED